LCHFDFLVAVLFDENFGVTCAYRIPHEVLLTVDHARREHVNGWVFHLTKSLWDLPGVSDITQKVQDAQAKWA
jgi:hypothetical protein